MCARVFMRVCLCPRVLVFVLKMRACQRLKKKGGKKEKRTNKRTNLCACSQHGWDAITQPLVKLGEILMGCGKGGGIAKTASASQVVSRVLFF